MGTFSNKIVAEFTPPKTWILEDELAFETNELKDEDIEVLTKIGANIVDTGRDTGRITCRKGMQTDLASVPRICWTHSSLLGMSLVPQSFTIIYMQL